MQQTSPLAQRRWQANDVGKGSEHGPRPAAPAAARAVTGELSVDEARSYIDADIRGPAAQGDVYRAALELPEAIALVDGVFEREPSVWHKEVLWALDRAIPVYGAASMGALRAAELQPFGMRPVGDIAHGFLEGRWTDDDEVAVAHAPASDGYRPLSEALVNMRVTLERAVSESVVDAACAEHLVGLAKARHYTERAYPVLLADATSTLEPQVLDALRGWLDSGRIDQKRADAIELLTLLANAERPLPPPDVSFRFERTQHWTLAAEQMLSDVADEARVPLDDLLDELRLTDRYVPLYQAALLRVLAGMGVAPPAPPSAEAAVGWFRDVLGLADQDSLERWLGENDLTPSGLATLAMEQAALEQCYERHGHAALRRVVDHLRIRGEYGAVATRARDKAAALRARGLDEPSLTDLGVEERRLWEWYFRHRAGMEGVPPDLDGYAQGLGFGSLPSFRRAVLREACFSGDLLDPGAAGPNLG